MNLTLLILSCTVTVHLGMQPYNGHQVGCPSRGIPASGLDFFVPDEAGWMNVQEVRNPHQEFDADRAPAVLDVREVRRRTVRLRGKGPQTEPGFRPHVLQPSTDAQ